MTDAMAAKALRTGPAIFGRRHHRIPEVDLVETLRIGTQYEACSRRIIGHRIEQLDIPVDDAAIDDFERRQHDGRCFDDVYQSEYGVVQILLKKECKFSFDFWGEIGGASCREMMWQAVEMAGGSG